MATTLYKTRQGEAVDEICYRVFESTANGVVEETYRLNQNLADYGDALPSGLLIVLPDVDALWAQTTANATDISL